MKFKPGDIVFLNMVPEFRMLVLGCAYDTYKTMVVNADKRGEKYISVVEHNPITFLDDTCSLYEV